MISSRTAAPRLCAVLAATVVVAGMLVVVAPSAGATGPSTVTQTFAYTGATTTFTVPAGITALTLTALGAQGGLGGSDAAGFPPAGGYQGAVSGTITVTPGQVLTIAVGQGGASGSAGAGSNVPANYLVGAAVGGSNPLSTYAGGNGGVAGPQGSSGYGAGGGAATVITTAGATIVAGGSGGSGGSGQYAPTLGRLPYATYTGRSDITSTVGQLGITVATVCNNAPSPGCDGGGSGGGGGGAQGGAQGQVQFGSGTSNEWFGYGGYPGQNSTGGLTGLSATYQSFSTNNGGGSVTISYVTGPPDVPTAVSGVAENASVDLSWTAPVNVGASALTDYVVQYAPASSPTSWTTFADGVSTGTTTTVTGLTNGTAYVFQVAAVNAVGQGAYSLSSGSITPYGPPTAPTITSITPADGRLSVAFSAATSGGPILDYQYQINGAGPWVSSGASSSLSVTGLVNGTTYSVTIRAVNSVGVGAASAPMSGTPEAVPGAPSISSASTAIGTATLVFTPGYDGGSAITNYQYQLNGGAWVSAGTTVSPMTVTGLTNGTTYAVALRAVNASGAGAASQATTVITPDVPAAPTVTSILSGDTTLSIAFTPGNSNGLTVTSYQYQLTPAGPWTTAPSTSSPIVVTGLTNGTTYAVALRAVNALGAGAGSTAQSATPATVPGAPTIVGSTVAGANQQLSAGFTAPASDGGSAITTYQYSTDAGATWATRLAGSTASPVVIATLSSDGTTPLVNGTTYFVELRAVNAVGAGQASAVASGIAQASPAAPNITSVAPGPSSLQVTFTPASNGGAAITGYQYRLGSGSWTDTGTLDSTFLIGSLTNGTTYAVSVRALNSQGSGDPSNAVSGTPFTTPGQPTITGVIRLDRALTVAVAASSDGGSPITGWQYSTDGGTTWQSAGTTTSPLTITTLSSDGTTRIANGTSYPISVRDVNAAGASAPSAITSVGPGTTPSAPVVTLTPSNQSIQVGYTIASNGGSPISDVQYRFNGGSWVDAGSLTSPFSIGALTNGTAYTVEVRAVNALGAGAVSTPASATPLTVPDPPTTVTAISDTASADVTWTAPAFNGGSAITGYVATAYATSSSTTALATCAAATTACSITGLTNGTTYYVSVVAQNAAGSGQPSAPRAVVTPLARPGAPTLNSLSAGDTSLSLAFTAGSAGSSPITGYQYQLNGGAWQNASGTSSPMTLSSLTNGTSYSVVLRAVSAAGVGTASTPLTATPYTFPDAPDPTFIVANGTNASIVVSWTAPNSNGSPITGYTATAFTAATAGTQASTCTTAGALTCTIAGLTNGTTYYVSLQAQNAAGLSIRSIPRVPATPSLRPGAVSAVTGVAGNAQVTLGWTPGSTGGAPISDYTIWYSSGGAYTQFADGTSTATTATVTGLSNGTAYTFVVYAVNSNGTGPISAASGAVTPLAPGTVPTESVPTSVAGGFTFTLTNYSAATTYTLTATGGATVTRSGAAVTVSGLGSGAASTVTVAAALFGNTNTSSTVTGSALITGVAPTFSTAARTVDGYTFQITNYIPTATYTFSATNGATVNATGSSVVVSGLAAGVTSNVTVTVALAGYTNASAVESSAALATGVAPILSVPVAAAGGFSFAISNFSLNDTYSVSATGGVATVSGSLVTVTGLADAASPTVTVTASRSGYTTVSASVVGSALLAGKVPTFSAPVSTPDGFTFTITDFDPATTYALVATNGATVTLVGSTVSVSGLGASASLDVTVTASLAGSRDASGSINGGALFAGVVPILSTPVSADGGFSFDISNFSLNDLYSVLATDGVATVSGSTVTVTGLADGASSTVTVNAARSGYTMTSASRDGTSLPAGTAPTFSTPVSTADGYTFTIANYDSAATYAVVATNGATVTLTGSTITVTGLGAGESSEVTVTADVAGYAAASASVDGSALLAGAVPTFSAPVSTPDGFTVDIANYDPAVTYSFVATNGATVTQVGATVTVTGLAPGASSTVTATATLAGSTTTSADVSGSALLTGTAPTFAAPVSTSDGFMVDIANYDPAVTYAFAATGGATVTQVGSTVTVTGLTPGASSTRTATAALAGYTTATATVTGSALLAGITPTFSGSVAADGGFSFDISNFSLNDAYTASATGGVVTVSGSTVTVTGLADGASSTVTVTAARSGYTTVSADAVGTALLAGTVPTFSTPVSTTDGYTFTITNYDPTATYKLVATNGGTVTRNGAVVTVTGLDAATPSTVTVTDSASGQVDATATVSGTSGPAATPTLTPTPTASATSTATSTPTSSATPSSGGTASSTGTSAHPSNQAPTVPEQPTGTGAVTISGVGVDSTLTSSGTTVNLSGHGLLMQLTVTLNGHDVTLSSDHVVRVPQEGALRVAIRGFKPGTPATVWGFSTPTMLTRLTIAADRSGVQAFTLPASMLPGPHTLVVAGTSVEGKPATMSVGILVTAPSAASAVTQGAGLVAPAAGASWWWLLVVAAVLGFGFFLLVWRRRKKDDEEPVAA